MSKCCEHFQLFSILLCLAIIGFISAAPIEVGHIFSFSISKPTNKIHSLGRTRNPLRRLISPPRTPLATATMQLHRQFTTAAMEVATSTADIPVTAATADIAPTEADSIVPEFTQFGDNTMMPDRKTFLKQEVSDIWTYVP